jgi:prolyl-tRNA editing enzyme YbaK/EbsC (Cys-tRNA(Pro) deacylase)
MKNFLVLTSRPSHILLSSKNIKMTLSENKFKEITDKLNLNLEIIKFEESTKTSQQAADVLGTNVAQIGKSIVFETKSGKFVLVVTSGANRVNEKVIEKEMNDKIVKSNPNEIRDYVGYPIGGIPPFGHDNPMIIFIDEDLKQFDVIFCAGGTPNTIFQTTPLQVAEITKGKWINIH